MDNAEPKAVILAEKSGCISLNMKCLQLRKMRSVLEVMSAHEILYNTVACTKQNNSCATAYEKIVSVT